MKENLTERLNFRVTKKDETMLAKLMESQDLADMPSTTFFRGIVLNCIERIEKQDVSANVLIADIKKEMLEAEKDKDGPGCLAGVGLRVSVEDRIRLEEILRQFDIKNQSSFLRSLVRVYSKEENFFESETGFKSETGFESGSVYDEFASLAEQRGENPEGILKKMIRVFKTEGEISIKYKAENGDKLFISNYIQQNDDSTQCL